MRTQPPPAARRRWPWLVLAVLVLLGGGSAVAWWWWRRPAPVTVDPPMPADVDLPRLPTYAEIRYLTVDEVWALVDAAQPGYFQPLDRALYLTAAMTGLRIGELQALDRLSSLRDLRTAADLVA